ncbi:hypothetical protein F5Y09DRAFT_184552 [Xylaria sp. FL1042]|nr:hypothetical protein F5Y09DRAFT_184552 [Xylaria sp. FL1042]
MPIMSDVWRLVRGYPIIRPPNPLAIIGFTFELPVDTSLPASPGCFETCANEYHAGQMSYQQFLDAALAHLDPTSPTRHPEDGNLANLAKLSMSGSMGPVAAAIKLCMLSDDGQPILSQDTINFLHAMQPSADHHLLPTTLAALPPLQLQVVILAALCREMPTLAVEILSANPPPAPPEQSLFNLRDSQVCPVTYGRGAFIKFPVDFWTAAVKAGWVAPSPKLAALAADVGPQGVPLLRTILDTDLDLTIFLDYTRLYENLLQDVARKGDDSSLLRDLIARVPGKKLGAYLVRDVVETRKDGGVEMLAILLDHGLNINYRDKEWVSKRDQQDPWGWGGWWEASLTALHMAARNGNKDAVSFLLSRGARVNEPEFYGRTARDLALDAGHHEIAEMLDQAAKPRDHWKVWCCIG